MQTVDYIDVQEAVCELVWGTATDLPDVSDFPRMRRIVSKRLATGWEYSFWPDVTRVEQRTPADQVIAYEQTDETVIGHVEGVYRRDPRTCTNPCPIPFLLTNEGISVLDPATSVWVRFRLRTPVLKGNEYSATTLYTAGQQIYYASASAPGNFYDCIDDGAADQNPDNTPERWGLVEIPRFLERYLVQGAYADWLPGDGQNEKRNTEEAAAQRLLANQLMLFRGQQGQAERPVVN